ncbi:MAG TPA: phage holin family protein [Opitutaceae bacterium]|nr:phage holin family protein [Opitutaceae bacterium]
MNSEFHPPHSLSSLIRNLRDETTTLMRQEIDLAKAELKDNTAHLASHAVQIAIGAFVGYAGAIVILVGIGLLVSSIFVRLGMQQDMAVWLALVIVGVVVALIGGGMAMRAKKAIAAEDIAPRQTGRTLRADKQWVENKLQHSP